MGNLNKGNVAEIFFEGYKQLNETKKKLFSKLCDKLLDENFVYGQIEADKNDYYDILLLRDVIGAYFLLIDYELRHDDVKKILFIESIEDRNRIRLKKLETILLIILRRFYYLKSREEIDSNINITITFDDLIDALNQTGIYNEEIKKTALLESLQRLKKFKIINMDIKNFEINNVIEIYPTVTKVVDINDINLLNEKIQSYITKKGDEEDEIDED